jgi:hypothetical protein
LAWASIVWMIARPILLGSLHLDVSFIFMFWAAAALKRRSPTARIWVLVVAGLTLAVAVLVLLWAVLFGTAGMAVTFGAQRIKSPPLWQVLAVVVALLVVVGVPFGVLLSERARRQFVAQPAVPARPLNVGPLSDGGSSTWMFEVYYLPPTDPAREARIVDLVTQSGGRLAYEEAPELDGNHNVCLTCEFDCLANARRAAGQLRSIGENVEGPSQYA